MIIVTYEQWSNSVNGYTKNTSFYNNEYDLKNNLKRWEAEGNPMIVLGIWKI